MLDWRSKYIAWYIIRCDEFFLWVLGENAQRLVFQESTKYGLYIASAVCPTLYIYIFSRQWRVLIRVGSVAWRTLNRFDALILFLHQVHGDESGSSTANDDKRRHSNNDCHYRGGFRCQGVRNFYKKNREATIIRMCSDANPNIQLTVTHFHLALANLAIAALTHLLIRRRYETLPCPNLLIVRVASRPLTPLTPAEECWNCFKPNVNEVQFSIVKVTYNRS